MNRDAKLATTVLGGAFFGGGLAGLLGILMGHIEKTDNSVIGIVFAGVVSGAGLAFMLAGLLGPRRG